MTTLLHILKQNANHAKLNGIIIAIGVNDAHLRGSLSNYVEKWKKDYIKMIDVALQLNPMVTVLTILPVEDGMPLGSKYFDILLIKRLNTAIRQVAVEKGITLVDANKVFRRTKWTGHYTVDGVHPTANAYSIFAKELQAGAPRLCNSAFTRIIQHIEAVLN